MGDVKDDFPGWTIDDNVWNGSQVVSVYKYKGKAAVRHVLVSRDAKQLAGYQLLEKDLRNIRAWLAIVKQIISELGPQLDASVRMQKRQGDTVKNDTLKALFVSILAIYGKLFNTGKGRNASLHPSWVKDGAHKRWHDELMEFRHSFAAHSGEERTERCDVVIALAFDSKTGMCYPRPFTELKQPNCVTSTQCDEIDALMVFLLDSVREKRDELFDRVIKNDMNENELRGLLKLYGYSGVVGVGRKLNVSDISRTL